MGAADAEPGPGADIPACVDRSGSLPHVGTVLPDKRIADIVVARIGSGLRMDPDTIYGWSLRSRYVGTPGCQRNALTRTSAAGHAEIIMPSAFSGGEGVLCAG